MKRIGAALSLLAVVTAACTSTNPAAAPSSASPIPTASGPASSPSASASSPNAGPNLDAVHVRLVQIASLDQPISMAVRAGDSSLYVAEKTGRVVAIRNGQVDQTPVLDLSGQVSGGGEQGLLGIVFSPDGRTLYVSYTDTNGNSRVIAYAMKGDRADPGSGRQILFVSQPFANHNGGDLAFGPDGYLYVGLGDGGSEGDPLGTGQRLSMLLAKMLRIAPHPSGGYAVPSDNPFVGRSGVRPEIWAYGLRNPWRYSFDRQTGDLWIGDVGQNQWEEIDFQRAGSQGGQNYGWSCMEGDHPYRGSCNSATVRPIAEYSHADGGCAIIGGYVYRGTKIPALRGAYLYGDDCLAPIQALAQTGGRVVQRRTLPIAVQSLSSFGQDLNGELYALSLAGPVYRLVP